MKILQVIPFFSPKFGGSVTIPYELSKELAKRKHDVTIITTDFGFDPRYAEIIRAEGITLIPFPSVAKLGLFLYSPSIKIWLEKNLKEFDIIHLHNFRSYQNVAVRTFALKYKVPYIVQAHGSVLPFFEKQNLKKLYDFVWGDKILKDASKLIASTEEEVNQYKCMGIPANQITIIPNGIDLTLFASLPKKGIFKLKYGIAEEEKIVLFLGRIHKIKGIDLLIEAFITINKEIPNVTLVIAGPEDGNTNYLQEIVEQLHIGHKVLIPGFISFEEKLSAYIDANVYVLPSVFECFPTTVLEAWACGTPVIISESCGLSTIAQNASIVIKRNPIDLAAAIKRIICDDTMRETICINGKFLVNNELNIDTVITNIEKCYQQTILNYGIPK